MSPYLIEFLGTFFLVLVIALTGEPIAIGAILIAMIYMGGNISGGHYNPAVTFAVFMRGKITGNKVYKYMVAQIVGGLAAALAYEVITGKLFIPTPANGVELYTVFMIELLFTFALCTVVLQVATNEVNQPNQYFGLAIGLTIMAAVYAGGKISGGVYNPAVAIGPILADSNNLATNISSLLVYIGAPMLSSVLAGFIYNLTKKPTHV